MPLGLDILLHLLVTPSLHSASLPFFACVEGRSCCVQNFDWMVLLGSIPVKRKERKIG